MIVLELERGCAFSSSHRTSLRAREPMYHCHNKALRAQVDLIPRGNCSLVCAVVVSTRLVAPILRFLAPRPRSLPLRPPGTVRFPPHPPTHRAPGGSGGWDSGSPRTSLAQAQVRYSCLSPAAACVTMTIRNACQGRWVLVPLPVFSETQSLL